mmetsp:Transcript_3754/g.13891  ORF Transcript_3754/g.13891 Transcript_3754/m.13891 type:complete len:343 (-) Transcript_3754:193-1221(-)|eukprot:CAMPEP_0203879532 /NCGR_PEP_ID=MMETSP0359-20131031/23987_1 /ASSEMBLY_ACC=CAM_ASM_000338 /TAXON_ID=268821 /ORGANISM="Scrippsiella Hangoei, Strain SHTV-5" /LENGTH=342 /DNA_ID=CAMNT_0050798973 /DNA_START=57 /DNA_END=1085 /DNA_ORIENTATION=+
MAPRRRLCVVSRRFGTAALAAVASSGSSGRGIASSAWLTFRGDVRFCIARLAKEPRAGVRLCATSLAAASIATNVAERPVVGGRSAAWSPPVVTFGQKLHGPREVPQGLRYCPDFISTEEETELLRAVDGDGSAWMRQIRRAQQFFGVVYYQTTQSVPALQPTSESPTTAQCGRPLSDLPSWFLPRIHATGLFEGVPEVGLNQVQGNEYLEDSGIGLHVEDPGAGETLATVSLLQPVLFTLQRAVNGRPMSPDERDEEDCLKILLEPRSLLILQGESRHNFAHAIRQSKRVPLRDGSVLRRDVGYRRVSMTCRCIDLERRTGNRQDFPERYVKYQLAAVKGQ